MEIFVTKAMSVDIGRNHITKGLFLAMNGSVGSESLVCFFQNPLNKNTIDANIFTKVRLLKLAIYETINFPLISLSPLS